MMSEDAFSQQQPQGGKAPAEPSTQQDALLLGQSEQIPPLEKLSSEGPLDEALLDQLVDGELSESQQRQLLQHLQTHPDGWRRIALAFLESQAWRRGFSQLVSFSGEGPRPAGWSRDITSFSASRSRWWAWKIGGFAVGILMAFLGGYFLGGFGSKKEERVWEIPVAQHVDPSQRVERSPVVGEKTFSSFPKLPKISEPRSFSPSPLPKIPHSPPPSGWDYITLAAARGPDGIPEMVRVPVASLPSSAGVAFSGLPIPEELLETLQQWGVEVTHWREFLPLRIEDGRHVVIPIEQVEIHYRSYQERYQ